MFPDYTYPDCTDLKYADQTCYIVGKGPSLEYISEEYFETRGPIIAINESIHRINRLIIPNHQYALQQDDNLEETCWNKRGAMILSGLGMDRIYLEHINVIRLWHHSPQPSNCLAVDLAKSWGCAKIVLLCMDALVSGDTSYAPCIGYSVIGDPHRFIRQKKYLEAKLGSIPYQFVCPEKYNPIPQ